MERKAIPNPGASGPVERSNIRLPAELKALAVKRATAKRMHLNQYIAQLIRADTGA